MKRKTEHPLQYRKQHLGIGGVAVAVIAEKVGTPFYAYSADDIEARYREFDQAFAATPHRICYAVKANSNLRILKLFKALGSGFDVVSGGEFFRALEAGADPQTVVYSGVGKTSEEIDFALRRRLGQFNVESIEELKLLEARGVALKKKARVSLRINPDVDPKTHPYIATGLREHKFGIDTRLLPEIVGLARSLRRVRIEGIGFHIGSQILETRPFVDAAQVLAGHVCDLRNAGLNIATIDLGGGLGIPYLDQKAPQPDELARGILPILQPLQCQLIFEPGRWLVGRSGALVTRVLLTKQNGGKKFIVVDAGMNDLIRPSLYQAHHRILAERQKARSKSVRADIVGPICETGDFLARDRWIDDVKAGDLLAVRDAGAYGFTLSSNYNSRVRCPEVLVRGNGWKMVRRRENYQDLIRGE